MVERRVTLLHPEDCQRRECVEIGEAAWCEVLRAAKNEYLELGEGSELLRGT